MPNYGYRCQSCEREFEVLRRMSDPAYAACPDCGGTGTQLFYPAGILFKGSGFYKTDSRSGSGAPPASDGVGVTPAEGAKPKEGAKSADGAKPADATKPSDGARRSDGAKPSGAAQPAASRSERHAPVKPSGSSGSAPAPASD